MQKTILFPLLLFGLLLSAQQKVEFGVLNHQEKEFTAYSKDTTAHAVYLYEKGENYFEVRKDYIWLITKYHAKKKILDKQGFDHAQIEIPYYHSDKNRERVNKIKAVTHNGNIKTYVNKENIYNVDVNDRWSQKKFTFPNVQEGSILEYTYEIQSPFFYNLTGWEFQEDIPKLYSEYHAMIPGNYRYNRSLIGELSLDVDEATVKSNCFHIPGIVKSADCEVLTYIMKDIPAFEEDEDFMLAPKNYRSRLQFELSEYMRLNGYWDKFTKTWKDVDKEFRTDKDIGGQLRKKNFFEKNVSLNLLTAGDDDLSKAKNIFQFVKGHYTWNGKFGIFRNNRVKEAFDEKKGNVAEINITLINLLNAAGLKTDLMLLSTRQHGLPKRNHPVMSDFNYVVAKTNIDGVDYLLDATEKEIPFGILPYRCLNYYGRVMDLDGESYWYKITPEKQNSVTVRLSLDLKNETAIGNFDEVSIGYDGLFKKNEISSATEEEYLTAIENEIDDDFLIVSYKLDKELSDEKKVVEHFGFKLEDFDFDQTVYLNPFLVRFFKSNPFKVEKRYYPIDFGYLRSYRYMASIKIPENYKVKELPKPMHMALPEKSGMLRFECKELEGQGVITVFFDLRLLATQYTSEGYGYVKEFFENVVTIQNKNYLVLEKI
ncbi:MULTISPECIES: DUF3857 domain-containing protein [Flavobacteriaceae]|uniref:DUF3857 domain-containing protein n=1 Tax=Flavobacteriaceae TaxID=49546 RepID=UPI001490FA0B|nr:MULTISPECIES: DUF3857 domain-containing protein [Allomuricauda]MDC6365825.1 DUF3857 domain-containing protein [Muricauda sp. AC10]